MTEDANEEAIGAEGSDERAAAAEEHSSGTSDVLVAVQEEEVSADDTEDQDPAAIEEPAAAAGPGTIIIPAGETQLPAALRRPRPDSDDAGTGGHDDDESAREPHERTGGNPSWPASPAAVDDADPRPLSLPPVRPNSGPPVLTRNPSQPPTHTAPLDPQARREAIEGRRSRRTAFVVIGLLVVAAILAAAAIFVVTSQRTDSAQQRIEQVLAAHAIALDTVQDANEPVMDELSRLSTEDRPDPSDLLALTEEAGALFEGLVVPVAEGQFAQLGRNLQNAIDAEIAFLDRLGGFSSIEVADIEESDVDQLLRAWDTAEEATRAAYGDQPVLQVPALTSAGDTLAAFGVHMVSAAENARERLAEVAEAESYVDQVQETLIDLEEVRKDLSQAALHKRAIMTSSDLSSAIRVVEAGAEGRWTLAERMAAITPPEEYVAVHSDLTSALEQLGDVVYTLTSAVSEADCSYYYDADFASTCPTVGETDAYRGFVQDSDAAGARLDKAKSALFAKHSTVVGDAG